MPAENDLWENKFQLVSIPKVGGSICNMYIWDLRKGMLLV